MLGIPTGMVVLVGGLLAVIVAAIVVFLAVGGDAAWFVSYGGTLLVVGGVFVYVVAIDSKRRWPDVSTTERAGRVLSFYRD